MTYLSYEDIKFKIIEDVEKDSEEVASLKSILEKDLIGLHHSFGTWIRNNFKLWAADNPLTEGYMQNPDKHPDEVSFNLIKDVWHYFNNK